MKEKKSSRLLVWIRAIRAPFFTATLVSGMLGGVCAWHNTGSFNWSFFMLTMLGIIFLNSGTNLINDYFDHTSKLDENNPTPTMFSGGSRVIQEKLIKPERILWAGLTAFVLAAIIGLYLNYRLGGNMILIIGIVGVFLGYFYTAEPLRIGYTPLSEIVTGICCGPLIVAGSYYVQAQTLNWGVIYISIPMGLLVALILYINEFPDYEADKAAGKSTLVVLMGKKKAVKVFYYLLSSVYVITIIGVVFAIFPVITLIVLLTLPLSIKAIKVAGQNYDKIQELLPANGAVIGLHLTFGLLVIIGYALDKIIGT